MDYGLELFSAVTHDQRDLDFANKYGLKVKTVVTPDIKDNNFSVTDKAFTDMINSSFLNNLKSPEESRKSYKFFRRKKFR